MKKIAFVLSGCGYQDGAEITESVSCMIALSELGTDVQFFAPNSDFESVDHLSGDKNGSRNIQSESARITRGKIEDLTSLEPDNFDALIFPGGFGAAQHLCDWAQKGSNCKVNPDVVRIIRGFNSQSKPIGACCISPVLLAKVLGDQEITLTIGKDPETAQEIQKTGAVHEYCPVDDYITDRANKIVTTPAYMYDDAEPHKVFQGIQGLVKELVEMA
jgi:enhancing lycopene biosynthesis protein 2